MELFSNTSNEIETFTTLPRLAWGLNEVSECTGLSVRDSLARRKSERLDSPCSSLRAESLGQGRRLENLPIAWQRETK